MTSWIGHHGAYAVLAIMALDALLPVGGELTMLYESYIVFALAGTTGYFVGSLIGWAIGRSGGRPLLERHGRWLHLSPERLDRAEAWFERHGGRAVFLGRLTPVVRSFNSIPAGALATPVGPYALLTFAGSAIWCFAFAGVGWALGSSYDRVHHAFHYVDVVVVAVVAGALSWAAVRGTRRRARRPRARA